MSKVIVIGAGAAGLMATYSALLKGHDVDLFDKNEKCGKKIYITGKGRCNLTNDSEMEDYFNQIPHNHKFLYSSLYQFSKDDTQSFFESHGCPVKVERGKRVFPVSNHAYDVTNTLERTIRQAGGRIHLDAALEDLLVEDGQIVGAIIDGQKLRADAVILATGGLSYPSTGSTGDGFKIAKIFGHHTTKFYPSLVPIVTKEDYVPKLQGLSLKNVEVTIFDGKKKLYNAFGEMLFTHYGVSGPLILSSSSLITEILSNHELKMEIDLKPALDIEKLEKRIIREFEYNRNKQFKTICGDFVPNKLIPVIIELSGIEPDTKISEITKGQRDQFMQVLKHFPMTLVKTRDFNEAIITRGGICTKEINPSTMESKIVKGLYFAGEIIDVDAFTGGYNLQIAWSTGYLAGMSIGESDGI